MKYFLIWWLGTLATMDPTAYPTEALCHKALASIAEQYVGDPSFTGGCHLKTTPEE